MDLLKLPDDILFLILNLTDLSSLFNLLRVNKLYNQCIRKSRFFSSLRDILVKNTTKKIAIPKYSEIGSIIIGMISPKSIINVKFKRNIKIGGPTHRKLIEEQKCLDIEKCKRLLEKNYYVIIRGLIIADGRIVDNKYIAAKICFIDGKFIHYSKNPNDQFKFESHEIALFEIIHGKKNLRSHCIVEYI